MLCQALLSQKCCVFDIFASSAFIHKSMNKKICFGALSSFRGHIAGSPPAWNLDNGELGDQMCSDQFTDAQMSAQIISQMLRSFHRCSYQCRCSDQGVCGCVCVSVCCECGCVGV